ncbi:glucosamine inositolphosphorylceramide transferase family protein [Sphingomonas jatrophae]|uniref:Glucosamine inositolphosphorylceramide transferase 1 N-terminal domain-containing protein n=1 Tax=Sphingomonas jatrophae TaxID=1166337 RepID=A0A1I6M5I1_9SPHN|nr:formyl transferase [Sphingomonas jatrophae]SFS10970.1 hypothetical protein SAMN05192580_3499 [Sphingomonas jatrophae]
MQLRKDIWRCAIVDAPAAEILGRGSLDGLPLHWLPGSGNLRYLADPFGLWRGGRLHVFAEQFDYRDAVGRIVVSTYDSAFELIEQAVVLQEPWHLSYPYVFEAEGETWMLPEAFGSGGLWLYRATHFPHRWERAHRIELPHVPLDATPYHDGRRWWLFYAPAFPAEARLTQLCAAYADRLVGPWMGYSGNPVLVDPAGARPGGTPLRLDGTLHLPVQDCQGTYGAALRLLRVERLDSEGIVVAPTGMLRAPAGAAPFTDGCHTISAAGAVTLIDVKQTRFSMRGLAMRPMRDLRRLRETIRRRR